MTTRYSVKRCNSFGFAQNLKNALTLFKDITSRNVIYIHGEDDPVTHETSLILSKLERNFSKSTSPTSSSSSFTELTSIDSLTPPENKTATIFVELGYSTLTTVKIPQEFNDKYTIEYFDSQLEGNEDFKHAVLSLIEDESMFDEKKLSNEFITYLLELYPNLRDYSLKKTILGILNFNNYNTIDLEKQYPFEYKEEQVSTVFPSSIFSDIEISVDKSDKNTSTSLYKPDKDFLKKAALGKTTQLDAFSENKFAIIHTKKTAGIENKIRNQNHDVLDTLAVNGVMKSPDTKKPLSIYRLVRKLEKFDKFDIVFIHPSYEVRCMNAEYPCEQIIPAYKINEGEILAVVYRYIVVYFFGYCSIFTDSMLEWRYYI